MADRGSTPGIAHRFFLSNALLHTGTIHFPPEQAHQIRSVLRLRPGERVIVLDGTGTELAVHLDTVGHEVVGTVDERMQNQAEPDARLTLFPGILKGAKLEFVLQKCTELGVVRFVPITTARSVTAEPGAAKQRRYNSIVREAAEQSRRGLVPPVEPPLPFATAIRRAHQEGLVVVLWEEERVGHLRDITAGHGVTVALFVGPEGGFTSEEMQLARETGAQIVGLGPRILRAETAAIAGTALLLAMLGDIG